MDFYPVLPADASPRADAGACCAPPGIVAVRPGDLRRPGQGGISALVTAPPDGQGLVPGEDLVFCHQVAVAPAVVRRGGEVQAGGWLPGHVTLGLLEAFLPGGEIEELVEDFGCAEERQRLLSAPDPAAGEIPSRAVRGRPADPRGPEFPRIRADQGDARAGRAPADADEIRCRAAAGQSPAGWLLCVVPV